MCGSCNIVHNACKTRYTCLKCAHVFTPAFGYSGPLSTANETCNKDTGHCRKKCRCTSYKSSRTLKSGVHLFAALENFSNRRIGVFECRSNLPRQRVSPCLSFRFCLTLFDRFCLKENSSLSSEFLCMTVGCRGDSAFALGLKISLRESRGLSDALGLSDIENLFTVLISIPPHHVFKKKFKKKKF